MKIYQRKLNEIQFPNFTLYGYSVAGEESVFIIPELDITFDIGKCPIEALTINNVLLTHGHLDHAAGLPYYFAQRYFQSRKAGIALVPNEIVDQLENLIECWHKIDGCLPPHKIIGMKHNDDFVINKQLIVRAFQTVHVIPSLGFSIIEIRRKLKQEFKNVSDEELIELKRKDIDVTNIEEISQIAYIGDTAFAEYSSLSHVANAKVLLIECTFFREDQLDHTHKFKHLHVSDLQPLLNNMNNKHIIITHVSKSIKVNDAKDILKKYLNSDILQRVHFIMQ